MSKMLSKIRNYTAGVIIFCVLITYVVIVCGCGQQGPIALNSSGQLVAKPLVSRAKMIIKEGLSDEDPYVRVNAIEVVAATRQSRLMPVVRRLLNDKIVPVVFAAVLATGDMEYVLAEGDIKRLLKAKNENIKIAAAYTLIKLGSAGKIGIIRKAIASKDQTVRANAALLLGRIGDKDSLKFLYWALRNDNSKSKVRFQAAEAIAMLGDEKIYPKLWTMLISTYADDRVMGIKAMGALRTEKAQSTIVSMLDDDVLEVRLAAAEQLGKSGDNTGEPEVLDVFSKNLIPNRDVRARQRVKVWTALAIGQIGSKALTKFLPRLLSDESKFVRIAAAKAVLQLQMKD